MIDKTLKVQKVKIVEEGTIVKLVFFIVENRTRHLVEIPLSGGEQSTMSAQLLLLIQVLLSIQM